MRENIHTGFFNRAAKWACLCLIFLPLAFSSLRAQDARAVARLDTGSILIGEHVNLTLYVEFRADQGVSSVQWPVLKDTLPGKIEIVKKGKTDTVLPQRENDPFLIRYSQTLTITSFDSGYFAIPPFRFILNNDSSKAVETEALLLAVNTVPVDTTHAIKDIKPPLGEPFTWRDLIPYLKWAALAIVAIAALVLLYIYYKPKKKKKPLPAPAVKIPAHVKALEALEAIRQKKLWQEGKIKQYYSALSDTLRVYIEERFRIPAMEQTSHEILTIFKNVVVDAESREKLRQVLMLADMVKFAKELPLPHENEQAITNAVEFVKGTMREETKETETVVLN